MARQVQAWVRCRLSKRGESQHELAQRLGVTDANVSLMLRSPAWNPSLKTITTLVLTLGGAVDVSLIGRGWMRHAHPSVRKLQAGEHES